ncbi:MAG: hypothetical protein M1817_000635 [Caeruleum heppii]|nr:MAG: hypothetical protein M1817_000635 [Caeruleum heppii]
MATTHDLVSSTHSLAARAGGTGSQPGQPPVYKAIGISLAIASGVFIGISFVLKKVGLLAANKKYNEEAGEGYGYLKNVWWWSGMTLMIIGEICNFVAYAFVNAILVTPLGALSVVITTILSAIFLKERLSFVGKVACFICIVGSIVIVINAPAQAVIHEIEDMKDYMISPGFLSYAGVIIVGSVIIALWAGPRYGKTNMLVYLSICSFIGGLSVVATQGLGAAVLAQARGIAQFNQWFLYVLFAFVVATLVTEIIYLNKALNLFNAALVTPTYYVFFTSSTIVTSAVLFRGFKGKPEEIATVVMGFLQICSGVVLLQLSKSAKDVPDTAVFTGDLDQVRTVAEQEQPESEPKADAIRGTAALLRRISVSRQKMEEEEVRRYHQERQRQMEAIGEDDQYEWDGLRRRRTQSSSTGMPGSIKRRKTLHPPLGLTQFPPDEPPEDPNHERHEMDGNPDGNSGFMGSIRRRAASVWLPGQRRNLGGGTPDNQSPGHPVPLEEIAVSSHQGDPRSKTHSSDTDQHLHVYGLPQGLQMPRQDLSGRSSRVSPTHETGPIKWAEDVGEERTRSASSITPKTPPHTAKRQFSFQNVFHRNREPSAHDGPSDSAFTIRPVSRPGISSRLGSKDHSRSHSKTGTEEERLGLVKGDSNALLPLRDYSPSPGHDGRGAAASRFEKEPPLTEEKELEATRSASDHDEPVPTYEPYPSSKDKEMSADGGQQPSSNHGRRNWDWRGKRDGDGRGGDKSGGAFI